MTNVFQAAYSRLKNSTLIVWIAFAAIILFFSSLNLFIEDAKSSRDGIALLELAFGVQPVNYAITYWTMSVLPQVVQIVFMYMFLVDIRKNWWAAAVVVVFFLIDFISDVQDRSNQHLFPLDGGVNVDATTMSAVLLTFLFFTLGSELFMTASVGLLLEIFPDALEQTARLWARVRDAFRSASRIASGRQRSRPETPPLPIGEPRRG